VQFPPRPNRYYDDYTHKTPFTDVGFTDFIPLAREAHGASRAEVYAVPPVIKIGLPKWGWLIGLCPLGLPQDFGRSGESVNRKVEPIEHRSLNCSRQD